MWLPSPVYEKAPHYWLLLGLLLIVLGVYLGLQIASTYLYLGVTAGVASCAWSILTYWQRSLRRERPAETAERS